jgi:hypothetical protein
MRCTIDAACNVSLHPVLIHTHVQHPVLIHTHVNPCLLQRMTFSDPRPYLCGVHPSFGVELLMRVCLGCLSVHEHTSRFARRNIDDDDDDVQGQAPCPACGATIHNYLHCPACMSS